MGIFDKLFPSREKTDSRDSIDARKPAARPTKLLILGTGSGFQFNAAQWQRPDGHTYFVAFTDEGKGLAFARDFCKHQGQQIPFTFHAPAGTDLEKFFQRHLPRINRIYIDPDDVIDPGQWKSTTKLVLAIKAGRTDSQY